MSRRRVKKRTGGAALEQVGSPGRLGGLGRGMHPGRLEMRALTERARLGRVYKPVGRLMRGQRMSEQQLESPACLSACSESGCRAWLSPKNFFPSAVRAGDVGPPTSSCQEPAPTATGPSTATTWALEPPPGCLPACPPAPARARLRQPAPACSCFPTDDQHLGLVQLATTSFHAHNTITLTATLDAAIHRYAAWLPLVDLEAPTTTTDLARPLFDRSAPPTQSPKMSWAGTTPPPATPETAGHGNGSRADGH